MWASVETGARGYFERSIVALKPVRLRSIQRQTLFSGTMKLLPNLVSEYLTLTDLDRVTSLEISPVVSRLRSVRVSIRCEMAPKRRRSCAWW
jgi:hypothetical protein